MIDRFVASHRENLAISQVRKRDKALDSGWIGHPVYNTLTDRPLKLFRTETAAGEIDYFATNRWWKVDRGVQLQKVREDLTLGKPNRHIAVEDRSGQC